MANSNSETYKVISGLVDFADGRVRAAGQFIELTAEDLKEDFNKVVIASGKLLKVDKSDVPAEAPSAPASDPKGDK